jgi:hypothetical protein
MERESQHEKTGRDWSDIAPLPALLDPIRMSAFGHLQTISVVSNLSGIRPFRRNKVTELSFRA